VSEAEWLASTDPSEMLGFLRGQASDRKLRLFLCACCRSVWHLFTNPGAQNAVTVAEWYADDRASLPELLMTADMMREALAARRQRHRNPDQLAFWAVDRMPILAAFHAVRYAMDHGMIAPEKLSALLRDLFGTVDRSRALESSWLVWNDGTVPRLAQVIYEERRFHELPILADALEDAGCADEHLLGHCRAPGEHARGCWAVDLLLGKS
jgi:hypothetical protein